MAVVYMPYAGALLSSPFCCFTYGWSTASLCRAADMLKNS